MGRRMMIGGLGLVLGTACGGDDQGEAQSLTIPIVIPVVIAFVIPSVKCCVTSVESVGAGTPRRHDGRKVPRDPYVRTW